MKRAMKKAIQAIAVAVLIAGGSVLITGSAELDGASASNACYYPDCGCDMQRRDAKAVAKLKRDKEFGACTNPLCFERVHREYRERLVQIEANYQLCLSWCYIGSWP